MRTDRDLQAAKRCVTEQLMNKDGAPLTAIQRANLSGMHVALQWVMEEGGWLLEQMKRGRPASELINDPEKPK